MRGGTGRMGSSARCLLALLTGCLACSRQTSAPQCGSSTH
jgi:hypothetical protein